MEKIEFKSESKRVLDLMINSIYTNKEIFLRELISNASDAIDKLYYKSLTDENISFDKDKFFIKIDIDEDNRLLKITDTGIGMTKKELEENLGVIAKSGSLNFKENLDGKKDENIDIIGQFGVGFYSAFMVADKVEVTTRSIDSEKAFKWESEGSNGYIITETTKEDLGTEIVLHIKENTEDVEYDEYLDEYRIKDIIKKHSDYIRYPIKMEVTKYDYDEEEEMKTYKEVETVNSMVPIWRKNKNELTDEDYINFYKERHFGFDEPLRHIHFSVDGHMSYKALLYIPSEPIFNYYTTEYEKGLELYSSGVLIKEKAEELLPDYFSFVKGVVDSEDLSLNISREMLQNDRQLALMAKRIETKIKEELLDMLENDRVNYEKFYKGFGKQLKYGAYMGFGMNKEILEDLLLFYSSNDLKLVSLKEYVSRMKDDQNHIYYASGDSLDKISKSPQTQLLKDKGYEILYLNDEVDEFALKVLADYDGKTFMSVSDSDLEIDEDEKEKREEIKKDNKELFDKMKEYLSDDIIDVEPSNRLKDSPVCLISKGEISIEMEKVLSQMPESGGVMAEKVLEINTNHKVFDKIKEAFDKEDFEKVKLYTELLKDQARLLEGLEIEDATRFVENISKLM